MPVNNSRFLSIAGVPLNINTGWQIRILDYKDMTTLVAICDEYSAFAFTQQVNDPGTGSLTLDTESPWWNQKLNNGLSARTILDHEYVFEAWEGGVARFAWLGQSVENAIIGEDEAHQTTISGPGIAQTLTWACIQRPGWPKHPPKVGLTPSGDPLYRSTSYSDMKPAYLWQFPVKWPTMRMWYTVLRAAQRRGVVKFVTPKFDAVKDSSGRNWYWVKTISVIVDRQGFQPPEPNENLLDFLNDCTGRDPTNWFGQRLEWLMSPGFKLDVRTRIGSDRSSHVRFFTGQVISNSRTRDREQIWNRITAVDVEGGESIHTDAASVKAWNLREQRNETNKNVTDPTLRGNLAVAYIQQSSQEQSQWSIKVPYDDYGRVPYHHFFVGDHVMLADSTDNSTLGKYRVLAISISLNDAQTVPDVELTLQSVIDAKMIDLEKQIARLINKPRNVSIEDLKDISIPTKPTVKSALVYNPKTKKWETQAVSEYAGINVYFSAVDPSTTAGSTVSPGDFWFDTSS